MFEYVFECACLNLCVLFNVAVTQIDPKTLMRNKLMGKEHRRNDMEGGNRITREGGCGNVPVSRCPPQILRGPAGDRTGSYL